MTHAINQSTIPFINRPFKHYISQLLLRGFSLCYRMNKSHNQSIHHFINNLLNPNLSNVVSLDVVDLVHRAVAGKRDGQVIPAVVDCKRRRKNTLKSEGKQCKEKEITGKTLIVNIRIWYPFNLKKFPKLFQSKLMNEKKK